MGEFLLEMLLILFLPLVHLYHVATHDFILNIAVEEATGLERLGNELLTPYQFVFWGKKATLDEKGSWYFEPRFSMDDWFYVKMGLSLAVLPVSLVAGGTLKGLAFLSSEVQKRYDSMRTFYRPKSIHSMREDYLAMGLDLSDSGFFVPPIKYQRREGEENYFSEEKKGLKEIASRLNAAGIPWWVDCGTLLGAYRYAGVIPWDQDIDIALLLPDFDNVLCALSTLDPNQFILQDWSSRERPKTYLKIYNRKTNKEIDLYFFSIHPEEREIRYILSLENQLFMPEWWHIRERRFKVPTSFDLVFPLKRGMFDGVEIFLPQDSEKYLQLRYGENLAPAKIYNPTTCQYENDPIHPYWERPCVH